MYFLFVLVTLDVTSSFTFLLVVFHFDTFWTPEKKKGTELLTSAKLIESLLTNDRKGERTGDDDEERL